MVKWFIYMIPVLVQFQFLFHHVHLISEKRAPKFITAVKLLSYSDPIEIRCIFAVSENDYFVFSLVKFKSRDKNREIPSLPGSQSPNWNHVLFSLQLQDFVAARIETIIWQVCTGIRSEFKSWNVRVHKLVENVQLFEKLHFFIQFFFKFHFLYSNFSFLEIHRFRTIIQKWNIFSDRQNSLYGERLVQVCW